MFEEQPRCASNCVGLSDWKVMTACAELSDRHFHLFDISLLSIGCSLTTHSLSGLTQLLNLPVHSFRHSWNLHPPRETKSSSSFPFSVLSVQATIGHSVEFLIRSYTDDVTYENITFLDWFNSSINMIELHCPQFKIYIIIGYRNSFCLIW